MNYIDLFAGAGGLSEGFMREGFNAVAHIEMKKPASDTLRTRAAYHFCKKNGKLDIYWAYLKKEISAVEFFSQIPVDITNSVINEKIDKETLPQLFEKVDNLSQGKIIDLIVGGPPCQAYSVIGRARNKGMVDDPRNFLYKYYIEFLTRYKPKAFIFENVPGLLSAQNGEYLKQMNLAFIEAGYKTNIEILNDKCKVQVLDATNFGVLQQRKRIIIVGQLNHLNLKFNFDDFKIPTDHLTVQNELLNDLPSLQPNDGTMITNYNPKSKPTKYQINSNIRTKDIPFVTWHITRPHNERDLRIYRQAIELWIGKKKRLKYTDIIESDQTHANKTSFLNRFQVVNHDGPSHTMVAHISCDGHYYIYPSLEQVRSISVREAARIQSFPDDYFFEGARSHAFEQIGNAVPPMLAEALAKCLKAELSLLLALPTKQPPPKAQ
jgi:DNA (cytosine-5)-methyltransferase 1